jgi:ABC-type sulfate/molybdate transport systems ATPase subunit
VAGLVSATASAALTATGVSVRRGDREVVAAVDLELRPGEVTALLGPNGAGKSTLLAGLAGLLPLAAGDVALAGRAAAALQGASLARRGARANVELGLAWWGVPRAERRRRAEEALAALGLSHLSERDAYALSGGEARRLHLARVLALDPDVLLLDEPFAGLDPSARADLLYDVAGVLRSPRRATCIVLHDRAEAWALADRVVVMLDGALAAAGPLAEVMERPPSAAVARFLGFSGELKEPAGVFLVKPRQVWLDPAGPLAARVARRIPIEDGVRLELALETGTLIAHVEAPGPEIGAEARVRVGDGLRFAAA